MVPGTRFFKDDTKLFRFFLTGHGILNGILTSDFLLSISAFLKWGLLRFIRVSSFHKSEKASFEEGHKPSGLFTP